MLYFGISFSASSLSSPSDFSSVFAVSSAVSLLPSFSLSFAFGSNQRTLSSSASNLSSSFRKLSGYSSSFSFFTATPVITLPVVFFSFTESAPSVSSSGFSPIVFKSSSLFSSALSASFVSSAASLSSAVESLSASSEVSIFAVVSAAIAAWLNTRLLPSAAIINAVTIFLFIALILSVILYSS